MSYYPSNCDPLAPHNPIPCEDREYGRIRSAGFIPIDYVFNPDSPTDWVTGVTSGNIIVIPQTNGEAPKASPVFGPKYGLRAEALLGYDFSARYEDPNYNSNCAFYNQMVGNRNYIFFYRTSAHVYLTGAPVTIIPNRIIKNDLTEDVVWDVEIRWISKEFPCGVAIPDLVFEDAYYYATASGGTIPIYTGGGVMYTGGLTYAGGTGTCVLGEIVSISDHGPAPKG